MMEMGLGKRNARSGTHLGRLLGCMVLCATGCKYMRTYEDGPKCLLSFTWQYTVGLCIYHLLIHDRLMFGSKSFPASSHSEDSQKSLGQCHNPLDVQQCVELLQQVCA
nr:hypothetical protein Iba_chr09cCG5760 [Ipomoea batatas]